MALTAKAWGSQTTFIDGNVASANYFAAVLQGPQAALLFPAGAGFDTTYTMGVAVRVWTCCLHCSAASRSPHLAFSFMACSARADLLFVEAHEVALRLLALLSCLLICLMCRECTGAMHPACL